MLPLPLKWCMIAGTISSLIHLVIMIVKLIEDKVRPIELKNGKTIMIDKHKRKSSIAEQAERLL